MASDKTSSKRDKDRSKSDKKSKDKDDKSKKESLASSEAKEQQRKNKHKRELEALNDDSEQEKQAKRLRAYSKDLTEDDQDESSTKRRRTRSMDAKEEAAVTTPATLTPDEWRKEHGITLQGNHEDNVIPDPFFEFTDSPFCKEILQGFKTAGFTRPTSIQGQSWPIALQGRDMISIAKTGSGKVRYSDLWHDGDCGG
jgi:ATP-dependent RNA helicase DDX5/DBP2